MIPYYLVGLAATAFVALVTSASRPDREGLATEPRLPLWGIAVISGGLALFSAFRYQVGSDFGMYVYFFQLVDPDSLERSLQLVPQEPGYVTLMVFCRQFTENPQVLFFFATLLTTIPTLIAIRRLSTAPTFSFFLYFFLAYFAVSLNSVRQSIAVAFMMLGESYRRESKLVWILCSIVAFTFHSSAAIVFVIQLFLSRWKPNFISALLVILLAAPVFMLVLDWGPTYNLLTSLNDRYEGYLTSEAGGVGTYLMFGLRVIMVLCLLLGAKIATEPRYSRWLSYVVISATVLLLGSSSWVFARLEPYLGIYAILLIPAAVQNAKEKFGLAVLVSVLSLVYFGAHILAFNDLVPYRTM